MLANFIPAACSRTSDWTRASGFAATSSAVAGNINNPAMPNMAAKTLMPAIIP
jgi:hypothetical protein